MYQGNLTISFGAFKVQGFGYHSKLQINDGKVTFFVIKNKTQTKSSTLDIRLVFSSSKYVGKWRSHFWFGPLIFVSCGCVISQLLKKFPFFHYSYHFINHNNYSTIGNGNQWRYFNIIFVLMTFLLVGEKLVSNNQKSFACNKFRYPIFEASTLYSTCM